MVTVSEIFGGVMQGEGLFIGQPAIFLRLAGCNLRCPNFGPNGCDSYHSVDASRYRKHWQSMEAAEVIAKLKKLMPSYEESRAAPILVVTGGEPTLQYQQMEDVVTYFITRGYIVQFETNATIKIDFEKYTIYKKVSFSMSVKLNNSGEPAHKRFNPEAINAILTYTDSSFFKFVVADHEDVKEANTLLKEIPYYAVVYLMPKGETRDELAITAKFAYEQAVYWGFRYSPRIHIDLYNDERKR